MSAEQQWVIEMIKKGSAFFRDDNLDKIRKFVNRIKDERTSREAKDGDGKKEKQEGPQMSDESKVVMTCILHEALPVLGGYVCDHWPFDFDLLFTDKDSEELNILSMSHCLLRFIQEREPEDLFDIMTRTMVEEKDEFGKSMGPYLRRVRRLRMCDWMAMVCDIKIGQKSKDFVAWLEKSVMSNERKEEEGNHKVEFALEYLLERNKEYDRNYVTERRKQLLCAIEQLLSKQGEQKQKLRSALLGLAAWELECLKYENESEQEKKTGEKKKADEKKNKEEKNKVHLNTDSIEWELVRAIKRLVPTNTLGQTPADEKKRMFPFGQCRSGRNPATFDTIEMRPYLSQNDCIGDPMPFLKALYFMDELNIASPLDVVIEEWAKEQKVRVNSEHGAADDPIMVQEMILKLAVYGIGKDTYENLGTKIAEVYAGFYRNVSERYSQFLRFHEDGDFFTMCDKDQAGHDTLSMNGYLPKENESTVQFRAFEKSLHLSAIMKIIQIIGPEKFEQKIIGEAANKLIEQRMDQLHEFLIRTVRLARDKNIPLVTSFQDKGKKKVLKWINQLGKADELVIHLVKLGNSVLLAKLMKKAMFLLYPYSKCFQGPVCKRQDLWDRSPAWDDRFMVEICTMEGSESEKKRSETRSNARSRALIRKCTPLLLQMIPYSMCFPELDEEYEISEHRISDTYQTPVLLALATGIDALLLDQTKDFQTNETKNVSSIHLVMYLLGLPFAPCTGEQSSTEVSPQYGNFMRLMDKCVTRRLFRVPLQTDLMSMIEDLSVFDMRPPALDANKYQEVVLSIGSTVMALARTYNETKAEKS